MWIEGEIEEDKTEQKIKAIDKQIESLKDRINELDEQKEQLITIQEEQKEEEEDEEIEYYFHHKKKKYCHSGTSNPVNWEKLKKELDEEELQDDARYYDREEE